MWMCDACNSNQCLDCIFIVDAVGLPKLAHSFEHADVNVVCRACLKADRSRFRLTPNYNVNEIVDEEDEEDGQDDNDYEEETALCGVCGEYSSTELIFCPHCGT